MNQYYAIVLMISICLPLRLSAQWPAAGAAADDYGYTWASNLDAENGPTFDWIDITTIGTEVTGLTDDNFIGPINMGLDFSYYWVTRSELYVGSNGYISFEPGNVASLAFGFPITPTVSAPNDLIAPFMCDLSPVGINNPGRVFTYQDTDNNRFIVSYINMPFWTSVNASGWTGANTFQVILDASDSTVTFQYLAQEGSWDPGYDDSANPMVVGIENVTGQIGLLVSNNVRPLPGIAVRFSPPTEALIDVADVDIASVQNESSSGFILARAGAGATPNFNLSTVVENVGNVDVTFPTEVTGQVIDELGQLVYQAQVSVPTLTEGQSETIDFGVPFNPPLAGSYSYNVSISNTQDANDTNDAETAEVVVVDTTGGTALFTYASGDTADIGGGAGGGTGIGDGGGVYFDSYGYPILVTAVDVGVGFFNNGTAPTNGFRVEIYQAVEGVPAPGNLVYTREVALEEIDALSIENGFWRRIELETPVVITEGGMYVGWIQLDEALGLLGDTEGPISRRTFEILDNNWAQNRSVNDEDYWIRAQIDTRLITTSVDKQLSGLETFELYPNPTSSTFNLNLGFSSPKQVGIGIYNMMGQKMALIQPGTIQTFEQNINASSWAKGIYLVTVQTPEGETVKRISIQ